MKDMPVIIETDIISDEWNTFWDSLSETTGPLSPGKTLVICPTLSGADLAQLQKMMLACMLTEDKYNLIQLADGEDIAWHQLQFHLKPPSVILLGILPSRLGISALFRLNEPNSYDDCIWIPSLSLSELESKTDMKKQLWQQALKPVFVDKKFGDI